jgi:hypothetical protein
MFEIRCAYRQIDGAIVYLPEGEVPEGHDKFCTLRVYFSVDEIFPPEPETGAELDWRGDIDAIEIRAVGGAIAFRSYRRLQGAELAAARGFLLSHHAKALWLAGGRWAERLWRDEQDAAA